MRPLLLILLLLSGCATQDGVTLPPLPRWQAPAQPSTFQWMDVVLRASVAAPGATLDTSDATFTTVNHETALAILRWSDAVYRQLGHGYTAESWDCDKFAKAYTLAVEWSASKSGVKAQPLAARISVTQTTAFGGVPALGNHALVGIATDRGLFVVEPQPGNLIGVRVVPLKDYPNRIYAIKIGG